MKIAFEKEDRKYRKASWTETSGSEKSALQMARLTLESSSPCQIKHLWVWCHAHTHQRLAGYTRKAQVSRRQPHPLLRAWTFQLITNVLWQRSGLWPETREGAWAFELGCSAILLCKAFLQGFYLKHLWHLGIRYTCKMIWHRQLGTGRGLPLTWNNVCLFHPHSS